MEAVEMTDISGFQQERKEIRVPSPMEIAIVSGRICRYAGNLPCSLLTHVMVGAVLVWDLLKLGLKDIREETFAWWILHDAHETITGDFAPHKCDEMKAWQADIDKAIQAVYGIDMDSVDFTIIHRADLLCRWLEARHYGSDKFMETFEARAELIKPSPEMQRMTLGIFNSDFGRMSYCVTDENVEPCVKTPVIVYGRMLDAVLRGEKRAAIELYDGIVVELGL